MLIPKDYWLTASIVNKFNQQPNRYPYFDCLLDFIYLQYLDLNMEQTFAKKPVQMGSNIQKFRFINNKSHGNLTTALYERRTKPVNQPSISDIKNQESINDEELHQQIWKLFKVLHKVLKKFDLEDAININEKKFLNIQSILTNSKALFTILNPIAH